MSVKSGRFGKKKKNPNINCLYFLLTVKSKEKYWEMVRHIIQICQVTQHTTWQTTVSGQIAYHFITLLFATFTYSTIKFSLDLRESLISIRCVPNRKVKKSSIFIKVSRECFTPPQVVARCHPTPLHVHGVFEKLWTLSQHFIAWLYKIQYLQGQIFM